MIAASWGDSLLYAINQRFKCLEACDLKCLRVNLQYTWYKNYMPHVYFGLTIVTFHRQNIDNFNPYVVAQWLDTIFSIITLWTCKYGDYFVI